MISNRIEYKSMRQLIFELIMEYGALEVEQLKKYLNADWEVLNHKLKKLVHDNRVFFDRENGVVKAHQDIKVDLVLLKCFWIVVDLKDEIEHHFKVNFPLNLIFYSKGKVYEVYHCLPGDELAMKHMIRYYREQSEAKTIIVVEEESQMEKLHLENTVFCLISKEGGVSYYE